MTQQCCCGIHFWNWGRALKQCAPLIGQLQYFVLLVGSSFSCKLRNKWDIVLCIRWAIGSLSLGTKHLMGVLMVVKQSNSDIIVAHKRWYFVHIFLRALSHWVTCWQRWCWLWNLDRDSKTQTTTSAWQGQQTVWSKLYALRFLVALFFWSICFMEAVNGKVPVCYSWCCLGEKTWHVIDIGTLFFQENKCFGKWAGFHKLCHLPSQIGEHWAQQKDGRHQPDDLKHLKHSTYYPKHSICQPDDLKHSLLRRLRRRLEKIII